MPSPAGRQQRPKVPFPTQRIETRPPGGRVHGPAVRERIGPRAPCTRRHPPHDACQHPLPPLRRGTTTWRPPWRGAGRGLWDVGGFSVQFVHKTCGRDCEILIQHFSDSRSAREALGELHVRAHRSPSRSLRRAKKGTTRPRCPSGDGASLPHRSGRLLAVQRVESPRYRRRGDLVPVGAFKLGSEAR